MSLLSIARGSAIRGLVGRSALVGSKRWYAEQKEPGTQKESQDIDEGPEEAPQEDPKDQKIQELTKQLSYALAEAENTRKIAVADVSKAKKYALKGFAKDLLDVSDNLDRALNSIKDGDAEANPTLDSLKKGVEMTRTSLLKIFSSHGITPQDVKLGTPFDPQFHEALFNMPQNEGQEPNTIGSIVKQGFNYNDRVLRASQVGVINQA